MYLIRGQHNLNLFQSRFPKERLCGTIGNFDGLHLGHQAILNKVIANSKKFDAKTIVFASNFFEFAITLFKIA